MRLAALILLTLPVVSGVVRADTGSDQLVLPKGRAVLDGQLEVNLSSDAAGKPISLAPDIWYGATDQVTVGLVHSDLGDSGFIGTVGDGICFTGSSNGCAHVYDNLALHGRYGLAKGDLALALDGGLSFEQLSDPFLLSFTVGLVGRWHKDKLAIEFQPRVFIALTHRSADANVMGDVAHDDFFSVPGTLMYEVAPKVNVFGQLGFAFSFEHAGDTFLIPFSVGASYRAMPQLDLWLAFSLPGLFSNTVDATTGNTSFGTDTDDRSITLGGSYAF